MHAYWNGHAPQPQERRTRDREEEPTTATKKLGISQNHIRFQYARYGNEPGCHLLSNIPSIFRVTLNNDDGAQYITRNVMNKNSFDGKPTT